MGERVGVGGGGGGRPSAREWRRAMGKGGRDTNIDPRVNWKGKTPRAWTCMCGEIDTALVCRSAAGPRPRHDVCFVDARKRGFVKGQNRVLA